MAHFKQCELKKNGSVQVAWIPEQFAHVGNYLELKGEDGWLVTFVGQIRITNEEVLEQSQDYKHQRKASDI